MDSCNGLKNTNAFELTSKVKNSKCIDSNIVCRINVIIKKKKNIVCLNNMHCLLKSTYTN